MEQFDVGVVMSSQSEEIFQAYKGMSLGAQYFYNDHVGICSCGEEGCVRRLTQASLSTLFNGDKDLCNEFFDKLSTFPTQPTEDDIKYTIESILGREVQPQKPNIMWLDSFFDRSLPS